MKNKITGIVLGFITFIACAALVSNAAPFPLQEVGGGTATNATSSAGQILISTGSSTYTPAFIQCAGGCSIAAASGSLILTAATSTSIYSILGTTRQVIVTPNGTGQVTLSTPQDIATTSSPTFSGILINGNVTTTNETVSSTLTFSHANASGSWNFTATNDGNYLDIGVTGTIPGTNPVPYNIVRLLCPSPATTSTAVTSSSWECDWGDSVTLPDGSIDFLDNNFQYYPTGTNPNSDFGLFDNARGTSSQLFAFQIAYNNGVSNAVPFTILTTGPTSTSKFNAQFNVGTNGQLFVGTTATSTGAFVVNQNGASTCAGIYDSGKVAIYGFTDSLPAPSGCIAIGGYYNGLAIQGTSSGTGTPIAGILNSSQSSNGRGHTALTVYDTNEVDTYNNELDSGTGTGFFVGNLGVGTSTASNAKLYVQGATTTFDLLDLNSAPGGNNDSINGFGYPCFPGLCTSFSSYYATGGVNFIQGSFGNPTNIGSDNNQNINLFPQGSGIIHATGTITQAGGTVSLASTTITGNATATSLTVTSVTNALHLGGSGGAVSAYAGSSCTSGVVSGLSASGTAACTATSTLLSGYSTSTPSSLAGTYLGVSGTTLTVSSTLASSSATFSFPISTTTAPYSFGKTYTSNKKNIAFIDCIGAAAGATTTVTVGYATTSANAVAGTIGQSILSNFACGQSQNTTTTFTTSTVPSGSWIIVVVSSTSGSPTNFMLDVAATSL